MAMVNEGFEQYFKLGKAFLNPWGDLGKTCMDVMRHTSQESLAITEENLNRTAAQLKRFTTIKRPDELLNAQKDCMNENISAWMGDIQKFVNLSLSNIEELNRAFTANLQQQGRASSGEAEGKKRS